MFELVCAFVPEKRSENDWNVKLTNWAKKQAVEQQHTFIYTNNVTSTTTSNITFISRNIHILKALKVGSEPSVKTLGHRRGSFEDGTAELVPRGSI